MTNALQLLMLAGATIAGEAAWHAGQTVIDVTAHPSPQAAVDALPETGGVVYFPVGTYRVGAPLVVRLAEGQHVTFRGEGRGSTLVNTNEQGGSLLEITGVDMMAVWRDLKITVRDLNFVGNHKSGSGLVVQHANDLMVDGCFFLGHGDKAVYLKANGCNATVRDCWMRDCKWGIYVEDVHHLTAHGNQMRRLNDGQEQNAFIYIDKNCREVRLTANHLAYGRNRGIVLDGTAQHAIVGNTIEGFDVGIDAVACRDMAIGNNYLRCRTAIRMVDGCDGFSMTGNLIHDSDGIVIENSAGHGGHALSGNVFRKSVYTRCGGIALGDASRCVVTGNVVEDVTLPSAITAGPGGGNHLIKANAVHRAPQDGIVLRETKGNLVAGNLISGCVGQAVVVTDGSDNLVDNNKINAGQ